MKFEHEAAFIERMMDDLETKAAHYLFDIVGEFGIDEVNDRMDKLGHFIKWFKKECQHDLIVPRGRHGCSYQQLRNDESLKCEDNKCVRCGAEVFQDYE